MPGIYLERCRTLRALMTLARLQLEREPTLRSLMLACSECWNDEASDAVDYRLSWSPELVPGIEGKLVDFRLAHEVLHWDANLGSVWAFAAVCAEEGWEEETGLVNPELKGIYHERDSPVMLVQRDGARLRGSWLGRPLRGWLDFPAAMQDREWRMEHGGPPVIADELPAPLVGREPALFDQVLEDPYDRGARDVLRDLWIERGDPRGEYCTASDPDAIDHVRAAVLIAEHGRAWVGPLQPVIPLSGALFGYGPWLRTAIVYAERAALEAVADAPAWGTVERLEFALGSARLISPRMANVRELGPLALDELAPLRAGRWRIRVLDVELARDPVELVELPLPLTTLRLRPARGITPRLELLREAPWWPALERLELWLPGGFDDAAAALLRMVDAVAPLAGDKTLVVGELDAGQRAGWTVVARAGERRLELARPNLRYALGTELAASGIPVTPPDLLELDEDWLTFGLGVPAIQ